MKSKIKTYFSKYIWLIAFLFILYQVKLFHTFIYKLAIINLTTYAASVLCSFIVLNSFYFIYKGVKQYKKVFDSKLLFILFVLLVMVITFFIGGHQLFLSGNGIDLNLGTLKMYLCLNISVFPIVYDIVLLLDHVNINDKKKTKKKTDYRVFFASIFLINFIVNFVVSLGFFPGNMTSDSIDITEQAMGLTPIGGGHPPFYTIMLRLIFTLYHSPFAAIVVNILGMSLLLAYILTYMKKRNVKSVVLYVFAILFTISCNSLSLMTVFWKDVPFTISLLWLSFELYRIIKEKDKYFELKVNIIRLVISLIFVYLLRVNGMFPYFVSIGYLIYFAIKTVKKKPVIIAIVASILALMIIKGPVFKVFGVGGENMSGGASSFTKKGIAALIYYDAKISDEDYQLITKDVSPEIIKEAYSKYNIDVMGFGEHSVEVNNAFDKIGVSKMYLLYIKYLFLKPGVIIKDRLDSNNLLWSYITPDDGFLSSYCIGIWYPSTYHTTEIGLPEPSDPENYYYAPKDNIINKKMIEYIDYSQGSPWYYWFWRPAFVLSFLLILIYYIIKNKIRLLPMLFPTIINIMFWVMLLSHQSYRYLWFIYVNTLVFYIITLNEKKVKLIEIYF